MADHEGRAETFLLDHGRDIGRVIVQIDPSQRCVAVPDAARLRPQHAIAGLGEARGDRVELRGFGAFSVKNRPARTGRNPRTGAHVSVAQKSVPFFKTGKEMRERLNRPNP